MRQLSIAVMSLGASLVLSLGPFGLVSPAFAHTSGTVVASENIISSSDEKTKTKTKRVKPKKPKKPKAKKKVQALCTRFVSPFRLVGRSQAGIALRSGSMEQTTTPVDIVFWRSISAVGMRINCP